MQHGGGSGAWFQQDAAQHATILTLAPQDSVIADAATQPDQKAKDNQPSSIVIGTGGRSGSAEVREVAGWLNEARRTQQQWRPGCATLPVSSGLHLTNWMHGQQRRLAGF